MNLTPSTKDLVLLITNLCMQDAISQPLIFDQWAFEKK